MKYLAFLFLSVAAGFGVYSLGAVVWSIVDPHGAGETLLFTIPIALGGMAIPGILGMLCLVFRCDFIAEPRQAKRVQAITKARPMPHVKPAHLPARAKSRRPLAVSHHDADHDAYHDANLELAPAAA
jgi:hypothetical protein